MSVTLPKQEVAEPNWDRILWTIKGASNTLAGWLRGYADYDDAAMKTALRASWKRNYRDPRWNILETYEAGAKRLREELENDAS